MLQKSKKLLVLFTLFIGPCTSCHEQPTARSVQKNIKAAAQQAEKETSIKTTSFGFINETGKEIQKIEFDKVIHTYIDSKGQKTQDEEPVSGTIPYFETVALTTRPLKKEAQAETSGTIDLSPAEKFRVIIDDNIASTLVAIEDGQVYTITIDEGVVVVTPSSKK